MYNKIVDHRTVPVVADYLRLDQLAIIFRGQCHHMDHHLDICEATATIILVAVVILAATTIVLVVSGVAMCAVPPVIQESMVRIPDNLNHNPTKALDLTPHDIHSSSRILDNHNPTTALDLTPRDIHSSSSSSSSSVHLDLVFGSIINGNGNGSPHKDNEHNHD